MNAATDTFGLLRISRGVLRLKCIMKDVEVLGSDVASAAIIMGDNGTAVKVAAGLMRPDTQIQRCGNQSVYMGLERNFSMHSVDMLESEIVEDVHKPLLSAMTGRYPYAVCLHNLRWEGQKLPCAAGWPLNAKWSLSTPSNMRLQTRAGDDSRGK